VVCDDFIDVYDSTGWTRGDIHGIFSFYRLTMLGLASCYELFRLFAFCITYGRFGFHSFELKFSLDSTVVQ
jgi:hypothetical protein